MDLLLFGIQGSGKGTQAKLLAKQFDYDIFEAGGELRKIKDSGSELGQEVASYIDAGNLVPHEIIMAVVKEAVSAREADQQILFDGIPRDLAQKEDFDALMAELGRGFVCIWIMVDEEACVQRILKRAEDQGRADDADEAIIRKRMATFHEKTIPVIEEYASEGKVSEVSGEGSVDEVYERLHQLIAYSA